MMLRDFYIFGLQRSGTTYVEKCLTTNFDCQVVNGPGTWKHRWPVPTEFPDHQDALKFVVTKCPYTWVESIIYRGSADMLETHGKRFNFQQAVGQNDHVLGHDNICLETLCAFYNGYHRYIDEKKGHIHLRYEDFLLDVFDFVMEDLEKNYKLSRLDDHYTIPQPGSLFMSEGYTRNDDYYYVDQKPVRLTQEHLDVVNHWITEETFEKLGYERTTVAKSSGETHN